MTKKLKKTTKTQKQNNKLPLWDLSDLYKSMDAPEIQQDLAKLKKLAQGFNKSYSGKIASLDASELTQAIKKYEAIAELIGKLSSYAQLLHATDMAKPDYGRFYQDISEKITAISSLVLFFSLEINRIEDADLNKLLKNSRALTHYQPWLRDVRTFRPHQLNDDIERLLHEKQVAGAAAWSRFFDETLSRLKVRIGSKEAPCEQALHMLSDKNAARRKMAAKALGKTFADNIHSFTFITNTLAKDKAIEDEWRKYEKPISSRNLANQVEDEVVNALITAVKSSYPELSHRYYAMKARWLGKKKLAYWDRNAPLPKSADHKYSWPEARNIVLAAYGEFSTELQTLGRKFFDNDWIDVPMRAGKASGAFAHPTVPSAHPYLLLNFQGRQRDVMTLAHELGHGVHQLLSAEQGALMCDTPLTLAETASVFGEQLTFRYLLKRQKTAADRRSMLAHKVEDMLNTVVRQIAFCEFERKIHDARKDGELSAETIGKFWLETQKESLGSAFSFDKEYQYFWAYISHFIHSPFYVYAYAFGDCLVNALYATYQEKPSGFEAKYMKMLRAGGTLRHNDLVAPFGLNTADPAFWQKGLSVISGFIDELESL